MHIESASIALASQHTLTETRRISEAVSITRPPDNRQSNTPLNDKLSPREDIAATFPFASNSAGTEGKLNLPSSHRQTITERLARSLANLPMEVIPNGAAQTGQEHDIFEGLDATTYQLKSLVETLTGKSLDLAVVRRYWQEKAQQVQHELLNRNREELPTTTIKYERYESLYEYEQSQFHSKGHITTANGEQVSFNLSHLIEREFKEERYFSVSLTQEQLIDPIVINLGSSEISLTERSYQFDLNADGELDNIHFIAGNNGFLAYDRNQNGLVDDGNELFGPMTGNGYEELQRYDSDGNQFIDAVDPLFQHLSLWQKDDNGQDTLRPLSEVGIGAIYVNSIDTPFALKDTQNAVQGMMRQSSLYVREDGQVGTTHQIDLAI